MKKINLFSIVLLGISGLLATTCQRSDDRIIASVGNKNLYFSDIKHIFPPDATHEDSAALSKVYIDKWIQTQLLVRKAEMNLAKEQLDISKEMETYRASLLIYKYEDLMLHEKLDTLVTDTELRSAFDRDTANFILDDYAVRMFLIQVPLKAPKLYELRRWCASRDEKDFDKISEYCIAYASIFETFGDSWMFWQDALTHLPAQAGDITKRIASSNRFEFNDESNLLIFCFKEKKAPGDVAPFDLVESKVRNIVMNKRKLEFIQNLERNIYNDAMAKRQFKIY